MKIYLLPLLLLLLTGCNNAEKFGTAVKEVENHCIGKIGVVVTTSMYGNSVSFTCDELIKSERLK